MTVLNSFFHNDRIMRGFQSSMEVIGNKDVQYIKRTALFDVHITRF